MAANARVLDVHPVRFMRGPGRVPPLRPLRDDDVRALLLVRLAADTGARRGEVAALHLADLDGRMSASTRR